MCHILETFLFVVAEILNRLEHKEVSLTYLKNHTEKFIPQDDLQRPLRTPAVLKGASD